MSQDQRALIEKMVGLLVEFFGRDAVADALENVSRSTTHTGNGTKASTVKRKIERDGRRPFSSTHDDLSEMREFLDAVTRGEILPEAEDVRQLASVAGVKRLTGKSRRDLVRSLLRSLDAMTTDRILVVLREAPHVTAAIRREGFAVLTDKLLEHVPRDPPKAEIVPNPNAALRVGDERVKIVPNRNATLKVGDERVKIRGSTGVGVAHFNSSGRKVRG